MALDPKNAKPTTKEEVLAIIREIGKAYPPEYTAIMSAIAKQESVFKNVIGTANDKSKNNGTDHGVFQINDKAHAAAIKKGLNPYDPVAAAKYAFNLLDNNIKATGSVEAGIAAYNGGAGRINSFLKGKGSDLHPITKRYAPEIMASANTFMPGLFSEEKISTAAQKFGYNGKADFVAMSGGRKNMTKLPVVETPQAMQTPQQIEQAVSSIQASAPVMPEVQQPEQQQAYTQEPAKQVDDAVSALTPQIQTYDPQQEDYLASMFGQAKEGSLSDSIGLPVGLMDDIRRSVEAA